MARGVVVSRLVQQALRAMPGQRKREWSAGPWHVRIESWDGHGVAALYHYGTKMLEFTLEYPAQILGWWVGWGSVSDQQGVNAALTALGSRMRYSRDQRGGGPRVNPYRVASGMARLTTITPPVY